MCTSRGILPHLTRASEVPETAETSSGSPSEPQIAPTLSQVEEAALVYPEEASALSGTSRGDYCIVRDTFGCFYMSLKAVRSIGDTPEPPRWSEHEKNPANKKKIVFSEKQSLDWCEEHQPQIRTLLLYEFVVR